MVTISLEVTPTVGENSKVISLDLHPRVEILQERVSTHELVPTASGWPVINLRSAQTSLGVKSGETVVLGGLIRDTNTIETQRIPVLSRIPVLGRAFSYKYNSQSKTNLLIFVTATLVTASGKDVR